MSRITKPWGYFEVLADNEPCTVKILTVKPHEFLSYQYHNHRDEYWQVLEGDPCVRIDNRQYYPLVGEEFNIPRLQRHQLIGRSLTCRVLEISRGNFDEEDIVRLEDKYNRIKI